MEGYFVSRVTELLVAAGLGAFMGSFLNVVAENLGQLKKIVWRRSACPHCGQTLAWYELIPLLSYLIQRGRCRECQAPLTSRYFFVEAITAILFGMLYWWIAPTASGWELLALFAVVSVWVVIVLDDWTHLAVDMLFVSWAGGVTTTLYLIAHGIHVGFGGMLNSALLGGLIGWLALALVRWLGTRWLKREAMGSADPWIALLVGLVVGWPGILFMLLAAFILGSVGGILPMLLSKKFDSMKEVPFAPYLCLAGVICLLWGGPIITWYLGLL